MNYIYSRVPRRTIIVLAAASLLVLGGGLYVGLDSLSAVRRIRSFYDVEVFGLREGGEMSFDMQESRRTFVYAMRTADPDQQLNYIDQARSSDRAVDRIVARFTALPFDTRCRRALADLVQGWQDYLAIRDEVIASILAGQGSAALAIDLG